MTPSTSKRPKQAAGQTPDPIEIQSAALIFKTTRDDHRIAWLAALAISIHILESALPSPIPGIKPGLANVISITVLMLYGWSAASWVTLLRVLVGSIIIGTFLTPTFMLSLSGAVASLIVLWIAYHLPGKGFGAIGYSLLASMAHMAGQFFIAYLIFIPHPGLFRLLPPMMTMAVIFGIVNGIIVNTLIKRLNDT